MATILCIEDEREILEDVVEELELSGFDVLKAGNGAQGLDLIVRHNPDLILCDINMPVMNGKELLLELRQSHPEYAKIPFIFLTALTDREDILSGMDIGADDYLTKPIDYEMLVTKITTALTQIGRIKKQQELETEEVKLDTLQITMSTVHDIVNNFLQNLMLFRQEAQQSGSMSDDTLKLFDELVEDTTSRLRTIDSLEVVIKKEKDSGVPTLDTTAGKN